MTGQTVFTTRATPAPNRYVPPLHYFAASFGEYVASLRTEIIRSTRPTGATRNPTLQMVKAENPSTQGGYHANRCPFQAATYQDAPSDRRGHDDRQAGKGDPHE